MLVRLIAEQSEKERHNIRAPVIWLLALMMVQTTNFALAQQANDALLTTPATPEIIARGLEADGYQLGLSAYSWGYPLVRMERVIRTYSDVSSPVSATSYRAPVNAIGWARKLATPDANWLPAPEGSSYVILRLYQPSQAILDNAWQLPQLVRVP